MNGLFEFRLFPMGLGATEWKTRHPDGRMDGGGRGYIGNKKYINEKNIFICDVIILKLITFCSIRRILRRPVKHQIEAGSTRPSAGYPDSRFCSLEREKVGGGGGKTI